MTVLKKQEPILFTIILLIFLSVSLVVAYYEDKKALISNEEEILYQDIEFWGLSKNLAQKHKTSNMINDREEYFFWGIPNSVM